MLQAIEMALDMIEDSEDGKFIMFSDSLSKGKIQITLTYMKYWKPVRIL